METLTAPCAKVLATAPSAKAPSSSSEMEKGTGRKGRFVFRVVVPVSRVWVAHPNSPYMLLYMLNNTWRTATDTAGLSGPCSSVRSDHTLNSSSPRGICAFRLARMPHIGLRIDITEPPLGRVGELSLILHTWTYPRYRASRSPSPKLLVAQWPRP
jgi:hypothetical protein